MFLVCAITIAIIVTSIPGILLLLPSTMELDYTNEMIIIPALVFGQNQNNDNTTTTTPQESGASTKSISSVVDPTNRTFYLENSAISDLNETKLGIPPDVFSLPQMTVEQGDNAIIHFYNLEDLGGDRHSFTLVDGPYNINKELAPQENGTITFNANQTGVFKYICEYHPPTMTGQLIVLPK
jgi:plastocyanin